MMLILCVITALVLSSANANSELRNLRLVAEWKQPEFAFPSPSARSAAMGNGQYIAGNAVPIDVDVDYRSEGASRVFVTFPRFFRGVPMTLGTISTQRADGGPVIEPYPEYSWHSSHGRNCDGITSVFRIAIDPCQRLWVMDTGRVADEQLCPPQILVFDLSTDTLVHRYKVPAKQYTSGMAYFIQIVLDVQDPPPSGRCANVKAYIPDVSGFGILVYDHRRNHSWRVQNKLFFPCPTYGTHTIAGESFDLMDGVFSLALSPPRQGSGGKSLPSRFKTYLPFGLFDVNTYDNYYSPTGSGRTLYFHSFAGITENAVRLSVLDNSTMWEANADSVPRSFVEIGNRGTEATAQAMDSNGNLFFGLTTPIGIACWDSSAPYSRENMRIVAQNDQTLQFNSGVKIIRNKRGKEELWVLSDRFQKIMTGTINPQEINFRIQAINVEELLNGNRCVSSGLPTSNFAYPKY